MLLLARYARSAAIIWLRNALAVLGKVIVVFA